MQPTGQITKTDRSQRTAEPDHPGPGKRDLQITRADDFSKPNPPFQPAKKAEAERQRTIRRIVGRHAYDVSLSYADVNSERGDQRIVRRFLKSVLICAISGLFQQSPSAL